MLKLFMENGKFRNFLIFQTFNGIGSGIFAIFMMWVIHFQYQNPFYTGLAGFMFAVLAITNFIIGPFVDRHNKATLIRIASFVKLVVVALILVASLTYMPGVWFLLLMILIHAAAALIIAPARTALMPRIVESEDLMKANVFINIVATFVGLGMGAFLYFAMAGGAEFELVYVVNVAVLLIALIASIFVKSNEPKKTETKEKSHLKTYFTELKEGFTFARRGVMMVLILMFLTVDLFASVAYVNVPMLAQVHTGEASAYILLTALALIGGLIGSYITRIIGPKFEVWKVFVGCLVLAGIARIIFVNVLPDNFTRALWIYAIYIGLGSTVGMFFGTLEQKLPPKHMVARISTITISLFGITSAFGALLGGIMGNLLPNVDMIFIIQGASYIAIGLCVCLSKRIRNLPKIDDVVSIDESANSGYN